MAKCQVCGKFSIAPGPDWNLHDGKWICPDCKTQNPEYRRVQEKLNEIILSTTNVLEGYKIEEYLGVESIQLVMGTGIVGEFVSDLSDFVGERAGKFEKKMEEARNVALTRLKKQAVEAGGNAVIGIGFEYPVYTGNKMGFVVYGTVVNAKSLSPG